MFTTSEVRATLARLGGVLLFTPSVSDPEVPWTHPTPGPYATAPRGAVMRRAGLALTPVCDLVWSAEHRAWTRADGDERAARLLRMVMADRLGDA